MRFPAHWITITLGELLAGRGKSFNPSAYPDSMFELYSVPSFDEKHPEIVSGFEIGSNKQYVEEGMVLLCKINPRINRVWVVGSHSEYEKIASTEWILFPQISGIAPKYLLYYMSQDTFTAFLSLNASGVGGSLMRVKPSTIEAYPFPLAPITEQYRIVDEIEVRFSRVDAWLDVMQKLREQLPRLRSSILKAAVEGRLVEQDPDDESAKVLLQRILDEHRRKWEEDYLADLEAKGKPAPKDDKWKAKYPKLETPDTDGLPELPEGWVWVTFEQIGEVRLGRQRSPSKRSKDYPTSYIRAANITAQGLDLTDVLEMEFTPEERERYRLIKNDIVISEASGSPDQVGKSAIWNDEIEGCCFQNTVIRLRAPQLDSRYLLIILKHFYQSGVLTRTASGVGINHLSASRFAKLTLPLAPERQQREIIDEVNLRLSVIDRLEEIIRINVKRAARMRQSVLKMAFEGRLVEQDSNDEPASKLLHRIQVERRRLAEEESQKPRYRREGKVSTQTERKSLYDTLREAGESLSVRDLFQQAGFTHETIDDFYEELRRAVDVDKNVNSWRRDHEVYLETID